MRWTQQKTKSGNLISAFMTRGENLEKLHDRLHTFSFM